MSVQPRLNGSIWNWGQGGGDFPHIADITSLATVVRRCISIVRRLIVWQRFRPRMCIIHAVVSEVYNFTTEESRTLRRGKPVSLSRGGDRLLATEGQDRLIKDKQDDNSAKCIVYPFSFAND